MNLEAFLKNRGQKRILVLSGAGLSAESGIQTFRDAEDALWEGVSINDVCNIASFYHKYDMIHAFYNTLRVMLKDKEPNNAHYDLSVLQSKYGDGHFMHITANVDDLYERAGGTAMHLHGNLLEVVEDYSLAHNDFTVQNVGYEPYIPAEGTIAKPNVVFIGESERYVNGERISLYSERNQVLASLTSLDTVVIIGSSDTILKWSEMVGIGTQAYTINVNPRRGENDWMFDKKIYKDCTKAMQEVIDIVTERMK